MRHEVAQTGDLSAIKADLAARIATIAVRTRAARVQDLTGEIEAIRLIAHRNGLHPAVTVARVLAPALARGERGALVGNWLSVLRDAIACDRQDVAACDAFAAACSVRLGG